MPVAVTNPLGEITTTYDAGRLTHRDLADGSRAEQTYDAASQLTHLHNLKSDDAPISAFTYTYDAGGNRTRVDELDGNAVNWRYDAANRLSKEFNSVNIINNLENTYDQVGNRKVYKTYTTTTSSTFDLANQLKTSVNALGTTTYTYDQAGNQTGSTAPGDAITTYTWDDENRQTRAETPDNKTQASIYHPDGLRYEKIDSSGTTKFVFDGQNYLAETDGSNLVQVVYTYDPRQYGDLISKWDK